LALEYRDYIGPKLLPASLVIDASGFDAWWFSKLMSPPLQALFTGADDDATEALRKALRKSVRKDLSLDIGIDGLHVPMVSQTQGPGFASLMVLGSMSDRILKPYI
jgi:mycobactin lysine-N-oxygenase